MSALLKKIENRIRNFSDQKFEIGALHVDLLDQSHFCKKFSERGGFNSSEISGISSISGISRI